MNIARIYMMALIIGLIGKAFANEEETPFAILSTSTHKHRYSIHQNHLQKIIHSMSMDTISLVRQGSYQNQFSIEKIVEVVAAPLYRALLPQYPSYFDIATNSRLTLPEIEDYPGYLKKISGHKSAARELYGTLHLTRVALWTQVLLGLYEHKGVDISQVDPVLLTCTATFRDVARENEVDDYWVSESADLLTLFYEKNDLEVSIIEMYDHALREVNPKEGDFKTLVQRIIHDANYLDMIHSTVNFDPRRLSFYQLKKGYDFFDEELLVEVKKFIEDTEPLKIKLESDPNPYQTMVCLLKEHASAYPHIIKLLGPNFKIYLNNIDPL